MRRAATTLAAVLIVSGVPSATADVTPGPPARYRRRPSTDRDHFTDDDATTHEDAINRLATAGTTEGDGGDRFNPAFAVRRDQMASLLARALEMPGAG